MLNCPGKSGDPDCDDAAAEQAVISLLDAVGYDAYDVGRSARAGACNRYIRSNRAPAAHGVDAEQFI
jgi:hypothetical protein